LSNIFQKPPQNYLYQVGLANLVDYEFTDAIVNFPAANVPMHNVVIPANTLVQDGQMVYVYSEFLVGAHAVSTVTITARQNTSNFAVLAMAANAAAHAAEMEIRIIRRGANSIDIITKAWFNHQQGNNAILIVTHGCHSSLGISPIQQFTIDWLGSDGVGNGNLIQRNVHAVVT
jgi:hypothetical protein